MWCCTLEPTTLCCLAACSGDCHYLSPSCTRVLAFNVPLSSGLTCMFPRRHWRSARNPAAIEQKRKTLQRRARSVCIAEGGAVLKYPSISIQQLLPDGAHLNAVGVDLFIDDLSTGCSTFLVAPQSASTTKIRLTGPGDEGARGYMVLYITDQGASGHKDGAQSFCRRGRKCKMIFTAGGRGTHIIICTVYLSVMVQLLCNQVRLLLRMNRCVCICGKSTQSVLQVIIYTPSRALRSSSDFRMLKIEQCICNAYGFGTSLTLDPAFGINFHIRHCLNAPSFKTKLKTSLFSQ